MTFTVGQTTILAKRGITTDDALAAGVVPAQTAADLPPGTPDYWPNHLPGLVFTWRSPDGETVTHQIRPDTPVVKADGHVAKYLFAPGAASILHAARVGGGADVLIVEGTCQTIAAAMHAPPGVDVYGIAGCQSWMKNGAPTRDLAVVDGRRVAVCLDADAATNLAVYDAGVALREACLAEGATQVRFVRVTGSKTAGLDDVLAGRPADAARKYLARLIDAAWDRKPKDKPDAPAQAKPKPKRTAPAPALRADGTVDPAGGPDRFYSPTGSLLVRTLANSVLDEQPALLTSEGKVALYRNGVYNVDGNGFGAVLNERLGETFTEGRQSNCEAYIRNDLEGLGDAGRLPSRSSDLLLNTPNGMVNLLTGDLLPWDPAYRSTAQVSVPWDPDAVCPTYDAWIEQSVGTQVADLEDVASTMLDPTRTPTKALFLFGPSRSGKSTFLTLLETLAGQGNVAGVTLAAMGEGQDRFAVANLYGKMLNVCADLSAQHLADLSIFKRVTGEDLIQGNRKNGAQFPFRNTALMAFSANEVPTVSESSRAYSERMKPVEFGRSVAGAEDTTLGKQLAAELPGILVRWVRAWQGHHLRGGYLPTDPAVSGAFEASSDRVRAFLDDACTLHSPEVARNAPESFATKRDLHRSFATWASEQGGGNMGERKFVTRLLGVPGVQQVRRAHDRREGVNVTVRPEREWGQPIDPQVTCPAKEASSKRTPTDSEILCSSEGVEEDKISGWGEMVSNSPLSPSKSLGDRSRAAFEALRALGPAAAPEPGYVAPPPLLGGGRSRFAAIVAEHSTPTVTYSDRPAAPLACPDCNRVLELVPPGLFTYACPVCNPATFTWEAAGACTMFT